MTRLVARLAAGTAAALLVAAAVQGFAPVPDDPAFVTVAGATVAYREAGEYLDGGTPVNAPVVELRGSERLSIMRRQVTRGEYARCAEAGACLPLDGSGDADLPATGISYTDAVAYAGWLTARTGVVHRLPTDREWALAAGSRYRDDAWTEVSDPQNPARRWLATYEAEAAAGDGVDPTPRPAGAFGVNEHGLADVAGNVWEWTDTCAVRVTRTAEGERRHETCGVRIAEGAHRAYMSTFFRDPKAGACSVGRPPANLGLRLVREDRRSAPRALLALVGL